MTDLIGKTLGQYQIRREIGRGGMAIVYEAYQPSLNRSVAIKLLPHQFTFDRNFVQRFQHEARAAAQLEHPNIVAIHDVGEYAGQYYIVMQRLVGEPLNALVGGAGRLPLERAVRIAGQVAAALDYAHQHGIVHRDIKPANIIVGARDQVWLTDFGIAKAAEGSHLTHTGAVIGTPEYMSPEQASGKPVGPASDIYSLGIVLYQMLAGQVPFRADSTPALLYKHVYEPPAPLRLHVPGLPEGVDEVLAQALAKDPAARFRTAGEFARALQAAAASTTMPQPATVLIPRPRPDAPHRPSPGMVRALLQDRRKLPFLASGAVVLLLLLVAGLTALISGGHENDFAARAELTLTPAATTAPTSPPRPPEPPPRTAPPPTGATAGPPQAIPEQDISLFSGPGMSYDALGQLPAGQAVQIVSKNPEGTWWQVCCLGGERGWVDAGKVKSRGSVGAVPTIRVPTRTPTPLPSPWPGFVNSPDKLRVRSGPGLGYFVVGHVEPGAAITVTGRTADSAWLAVDAGADRRGWVSQQYIRADYGPEAAPVVPTPSLAKSIKVAQAHEDFAPRQGTRDWFYLISSSRGVLPATPMPWDETSGKWYRWCCSPTYNQKMRLSDSGGHPSQDHDVARLWVSPYEGTLRIFGSTYKESGDGLGGSGVFVRILHNQLPVWERVLSAYQSNPVNFDLTVEGKSGDNLYFVINSYGDDNKDNTIFDPTIELQQRNGVSGPAPTSWPTLAGTPTPTVPPPPQLCFQPRLRHVEDHKGCCAEVAGLVYNFQGQPWGPPKATMHIEGPPATDRYARDFGVDPSGGYNITALSVDVYTLQLRGPNINSKKHEVRFNVSDGSKIRAIVDFYQVACQ